MKEEITKLEAELLNQKIVQIYNEIQPLVTELKECLLKYFSSDHVVNQQREAATITEMESFLNDWFRFSVTYRNGSYTIRPRIIELPKNLPPILHTILLSNAVAEHLALVKSLRTAPSTATDSADIKLWKSYFGEPGKHLNIPDGYIYAGEEQLPSVEWESSDSILWLGIDKPEPSTGVGPGPYAVKLGSSVYDAILILLIEHTKPKTDS